MDSFSGRSNRSVPQREYRDSEQRRAPAPLREVEEAPVERPAERRVSTAAKTKAPRFNKWTLIVASLLVASITGWLVWSFLRPSAGLPGVKADAYQAVWLSDKSLYFGKLSVASDEYYRMTNVYYSQVTAGNEKNAEQNVQLVKLGNELPYAEDEIIISKKQVLFYENLKSDSKVTQAIDDYSRKK